MLKTFAVLISFGLILNAQIPIGVGVYSAGSSNIPVVPDPTYALIKDEFVGGRVAPLGELGWDSTNAGAGTCSSLTPIAAVASHPGLFRARTTTSSGDGCSTSLASTNYSGAGITQIHNLGSSSSTTGWEFIFIWATDAAAVTTTAYFIGLGTTANSFLGGTGSIGIRSDTSATACGSGADSTTNWVFHARSSSTNTCTDSGVAVAANTWYKLRITSTTLGTVNYELSTNGGAYTSPVSISTNVPTVDLFPMFQVVTRTTAARDLTIDYFAGWLKGLTR